MKPIQSNLFSGFDFMLRLSCGCMWNLIFNKILNHFDKMAYCKAH